MVSSVGEQLEERRAEGRLRRLRTFAPAAPGEIAVDGRPLLNFGSNDYLGLSKHPLLKERAIDYIQRYGVGSTASRLICGNLEPFRAIETKLAALKGTEAALILPSGYQTNSTVLAALYDADTFVACDRLSHNSLLVGAQHSGARFARYNHNDYEHLERLLQTTASKYSKKWIVTESVFGMDGDMADLDRIAALAEQYGAMTFVDEAHATGVLGSNGMGATVDGANITVAMGTFSKGCGSFGGYVACSNEMREYLINFCSGFIYSTALPPSVLGAIDAALDLIPAMENERKQLMENSSALRASLNALGFATMGSTHIVPAVVRCNEAALSLASHLEEHGVFAPAIRPPTVPDATARIRFSLTAEHSKQSLERIVEILRCWNAN